MGSMLGTLVLRVERSYIVRVLEESLDMGELTFHAEKNCMLTMAAGNQSTCLALVRQTTL